MNEQLPGVIASISKCSADVLIVLYDFREGARWDWRRSEHSLLGLEFEEGSAFWIKKTVGRVEVAPGTTKT